EAVMHLDDLGVVVFAEDGGGPAGEGEEQVDADRVVARPDAGDAGGLGEQALFFLGRVAGGADDEGLAGGDGQGDDLGGDLVKAEVDDGVGQADAGGEVVAGVEGGDHGVTGFVGGGDDGQAHAALGPDESDFKRHGGKSGRARSRGYLPQALRAAIRVAWLALVMPQRGARTSSPEMMPARARATFTGTGLGSMKRVLKIG